MLQIIAISDRQLRRRSKYIFATWFAIGSDPDKNTVLGARGFRDVGILVDTNETLAILKTMFVRALRAMYLATGLVIFASICARSSPRAIIMKHPETTRAAKQILDARES